MINYKNVDNQKTGRKPEHPARPKLGFIILALWGIGAVFLFLSFIVPFFVPGPNSWNEPMSDRQATITYSLLGLSMLLIILGLLLLIIHRAHIKREAGDTILEGKVNIDKQKRVGTRYIAIGILIGVVAAILFYFDQLLIGVIVGAFALGSLSAGIGILTSGVPGGLPGQVVHRFCPYCHHELQDKDLPTPGLHAVCPKCGRTFGRAQW